jgi:photosynthetic reaction center H subunit
MGTGAITQYVDVAQLVLYLFWIFFFGLIYYLVRENHREGYPMETDSGRGTITGWPVPQPKTYTLSSGAQFSAPRPSAPEQVLAEPSHGWIGAPLDPINANPMLDCVGPGSYAQRADVPDVNAEGHPRLQPLRLASAYGVSLKNADPRGLPVLGADGVAGGTVADLWIDHSEHLFRYIEVRLADGSRNVMLPINFARIRSDSVQVKSIMGRHFKDVPAIRRDDQITFLEEEKVMGYYGAGTLYADPARMGPLV